MILLINICKEKLHFYEFVKPVGDILSNAEGPKVKGFIRHYTCLTKRDLAKASKVIICGTSLKDNEFLKNLKQFDWIPLSSKPILGICGGAHVMGLALGRKLKKKKEIGLKLLNLKREFLGSKGKKQVYHLHKFQVLQEVFYKKNLYATLFHPEVRNKEMILEFVKSQ